VAAILDDFRWLVSEAAAPWLAIASEEEADGATARLLSRLRRDLSAERAHLVVELAELRRRAKEKFSLAERMFFTRKGLEQATDEQLAANKANRFPAGEVTIDLCCGIGGDLVAIARRGTAQGVDCDPIAALLADANARAVDLPVDQCAAKSGDAMQTSLECAAWHCDPDRRAAGRRTTRGELYEPTLEALDRLLGQNSCAAIKLAPATEAPAHWQEAAELQWLGSRGECRQQVAWFGSVARHPGRRSATVIGPDGAVRTVIGEATEPPPAVASLGRYIFEPHAAVLAAKLTAAVCDEHGIAPIASGIAYLTGERPIQDAALAAFEIRDVLPLDRKQLKAYCRERALGRLEIKKRGVEVDPERLRMEIVADGDNEATLIIAPLGGKSKVIVARRIVAES
jgi:THUMP domain-like